jgi:ACT domain-containing protein
VNKDGIPMAGKQMAKRIHETLKEMGMPMKVHYKIRQGVFWTDDMGKQASDEMLKTIYGRR